MNIKLNIAPEKCILVDGPASITVNEGNAVILASPIMKGAKIIVEEGKRVPLDCLTKCDITLNLQDNNQFVVLEFSSIPTSWRSVARNSFEKKISKIMVIGEANTGKSSFCTYLSNMLIKKESKTYILDLDLGQSDLGPPTTIGLGMIENLINSIPEAHILYLYFVGSIAPDKVTKKIFEGTKKLTSVGPSNHSMIVNTDGWISDESAVSYKLELIDLIKPDMVIGLGDTTDKILGISNVPTFKAHSPSNVLRRTIEKRRAFRERKFYKYLLDGKTKRYDLKTVIYRGQTERGRNLNYLVGLTNSDGWLLAIGILKELDFKLNLAKIYTNCKGQIHCICEGHLKINEKGEEIPKIMS